MLSLAVLFSQLGCFTVNQSETEDEFLYESALLDSAETSQKAITKRVQVESVQITGNVQPL